MPIIVAWIVEALVWVFRSRIGFILAAGLAWLGINLVTFNVVLEPAIDILNGALNNAEGASGIGHTMWQWFQVLQFPGALQMVVTAYATRAGIKAGLIAISKAGG